MVNHSILYLILSFTCDDRILFLQDHCFAVALVDPGGIVPVLFQFRVQFVAVLETIVAATRRI